MKTKMIILKAILFMVFFFSINLLIDYNVFKFEQLVIIILCILITEDFTKDLDK